MAITLSQTATAVAERCKASFSAIGGVEPYTYGVESGGAGGTINATTGAYTAPLSFKSSPFENVDTIVVNDSNGETAKATILVGSPLILFCEIIQKELGLKANRVYLWDQKIMQPTDYGLYIAVSVGSTKPFGNSNSFLSETNEQNQFVSMQALLDIDIISRGTEARDRKEEVILALNSNYSQKQQNANSFYIGTISTRFINLSDIDGAAIPYRYRISVNMQYIYQKQTQVQYYDNFSDATVLIGD